MMTILNIDNDHLHHISTYTHFNLRIILIFYNNNNNNNINENNIFMMSILTKAELRARVGRPQTSSSPPPPPSNFIAGRSKAALLF